MCIFHALNAARHAIESPTADDDIIIIRVCVSAPHSDTFRDIVPSGNPIDPTPHLTCRIIDRCVAAHWGPFDTTMFFRQTGAIPSSANRMGDEIKEKMKAPSQDDAMRASWPLLPHCCQQAGARKPTILLTI